MKHPIKLSRTDLILLTLLTLFWGINWPVMKFAVLEYPPLAFRALSMCIGIAGLWVWMKIRKESFFVPITERKRLVHLAIGNMVIWHLFAIYAIKYLSSGRAAIIGYTMPVWALLASVLFFKDRLTWRGGVGVLLAMLATLLLTIDELGSLLGKPLGLVLMTIAAIGWGIGTAMMNHMKVSISNASLTFWMMVLTCTVLALGSALLEMHDWRMPHFGEWMTIFYNAFVVFCFCHIAWFRLARKLPPVASSLSIMLIPPLGVIAGAWSLGETVSAWDVSALLLILLSMAAVLVPGRKTKPATAEPQ